MNRGLVSLVTFSLLLAIVHGSMITVSPTSLAAEVGLYHNSISGVDVKDKGVKIASSGQSAAGTGACSSSIILSQTGGAANTTITSGDYVHMVNVTLTNTSLQNACFKVTASYNGLVLTALYLNSTATPTLNDFALCRFDLQTSTLSGAYTLEVQLQRLS